jgi:hypothetical protein
MQFETNPNCLLRGLLAVVGALKSSFVSHSGTGASDL